MQKLADLWATPEAAEEMTLVANNLIEYLSGALSDGLIQNEIDHLINDAAKRCPHSPYYKPGFEVSKFQSYRPKREKESSRVVLVLAAVVASLAACVGALVFVIRFITRRRHAKWLKTLPNSQLFLIRQRQEIEEEREAELNSMTSSMFTSPVIPVWVRWIIPVIVVGNVGFFLSGHISLGAEVKIIISIAGETLKIEEFYQFSLANSTLQIWEADGRLLAILILIFSGIWPYTKQLITLILWFLPPSRCSISRRGAIFVWLDTLAKWSIVDIFTLIMSIVAFRYVSVANLCSFVVLHD
jgi:Paraquat-inducible protein A